MAFDDQRAYDEAPDDGPERVPPSLPRRESRWVLVVGISMFLLLLGATWSVALSRRSAEATTPDTLGVTATTYLFEALLYRQARIPLDASEPDDQLLARWATQVAAAWVEIADEQARGPGRAKAYVNAAALLGAAGELTEARTRLEQAVVADPDRADAYRELLDLYRSPPAVTELSPATAAVLRDVPGASLIRARVADVRGEPEAEVRAALRAGARIGNRVLAVMVLFLALTGGIIALAVILWVYTLATKRGVGMVAKEAADVPAGSAPCGPGMALILLSSVYLLQAALTGTALRLFPAADGPQTTRLLIGGIILIVSVVIVLGLFLTYRGKPFWDWRYFGWRPTSRGVGYGILALVITLPIVWVSVLLSSVLVDQFGAPDPPNPIIPLLTDARNAWVLIFAALVAVVVAPLVEETLYRGILFQAFDARMALWSAAILSGVLFAAVHGQLVVMVPFTILGALFALLTRRTGSLYAAAGAHAAFNAFSTSLALLLGWALRGVGG